MGLLDRCFRPRLFPTVSTLRDLRDSARDIEFATRGTGSTGVVKMMKDEPSIWEDARKIPLQRDPEGGTALRAQSAVNDEKVKSGS